MTSITCNLKYTDISEINMMLNGTSAQGELSVAKQNTKLLHSTIRTRACVVAGLSLLPHPMYIPCFPESPARQNDSIRYLQISNLIRYRNVTQLLTKNIHAIQLQQLSSSYARCKKIPYIYIYMHIYIYIYIIYIYILQSLLSASYHKNLVLDLRQT